MLFDLKTEMIIDTTGTLTEEERVELRDVFLEALIAVTEARGMLLAGPFDLVESTPEEGGDEELLERFRTGADFVQAAQRSDVVEDIRQVGEEHAVIYPRGHAPIVVPVPRD